MRLPLLTLLALCTASWAADTAPPAKDTAKEATPAELPAPTQQGFLGIGPVEVDESLAYHLKLDNDLGIMVGEVHSGSAADKMGIKTFDVIVSCDGVPIYTPRAFTGLIRKKKIGEQVAVEIRRGAETVKLTGTIQARPPGMEERSRPGLPGGFRDADSLRQHMDDLLRRRQHPGNGPAPKRGRVEKPDGSVMEWSIEDDSGK